MDLRENGKYDRKTTSYFPARVTWKIILSTAHSTSEPQEIRSHTPFSFLEVARGLPAEAVHTPPGPGPTLRTAEHRQPPGALRGNKHIKSPPSSGAQLKAAALGDCWVLGRAPPQELFSHERHGVSQLGAAASLTHRGFPLGMGKPLAASSRNFGG